MFSKLILSLGIFFNILEIKSLASGSIGKRGGEGQTIFTFIIYQIKFMAIIQQDIIYKKLTTNNRQNLSSNNIFNNPFIFSLTSQIFRKRP